MGEGSVPAVELASGMQNTNVTDEIGGVLELTTSLQRGSG